MTSSLAPGRLFHSTFQLPLVRRNLHSALTSNTSQSQYISIMHSFGQVWSADNSNDDILNLEEPIESFECSSHCANRHHPGHPWLASKPAINPQNSRKTIN